MKKNPESSNPGWILLPEQMDVLSKKPYSYNATAGSFLELLFLQKFWTWLIDYIPTRIAPCVLTCLGLAINLGCGVTLLYFSPDAQSEAPRWAYFVCAVGIFLYQTLDALDGKQCIKVQDTQIEEVYDHGCDGISIVFVCMTSAVTCQLGNVPLLMFCYFIATVLAFYITHWQDHVTHIMVFGKVDVSEAQFSVMCVQFLTALYGPSIWRKELLFGLEYRMIIAICVFSTLTVSMVSNIGYILGNKTPLDDVVNIPRKKTPQIWNPVFPITALTFLAILAYKDGLFEPTPCIFVTAFGFAYAKLTVKLVISNVTHADMDIWDGCIVASFLLCLNNYLPETFMIPPSTALLCGLVYNLMDLARYFTYISWDMREALDVWIFSLKYPPGHPKFHKNKNQGIYVNGLNNNDVLSSSLKSQDKKD